VLHRLRYGFGSRVFAPSSRLRWRSNCWIASAARR
jgi:hypothetical protein